MKTYETDSPVFSTGVSILETTDTDNAGNFNVSTKQLYENTLVLKKNIEEPSGVTAGTYRSVTVDAKGRVVAGSNPNSGVAAGTYDSVTVNAQGYVTSGSNPTRATAGTYDSVTVNAQGYVTGGSNPTRVAAGTYDSVTVDAQGYVTGGSNPTRATAGTYKSVTVNAQGYVTGGSNPTTLAGYGITNTIPVVVSTTAPADTTALWIS